METVIQLLQLLAVFFWHVKKHQENTNTFFFFFDHLVTSHLLKTSSLIQDYIQLNKKLEMHLTKALLERAVAIFFLFRIALCLLILTWWLSAAMSLEDLFHLPCLCCNMLFCVFSFILWVQWKHVKYLAIEYGAFSGSHNWSCSLWLGQTKQFSEQSR